MSHALRENADLNEVEIGTGRGDHPHPPQSDPTQELRGASNFVDGSGPIFSMYLEMATEEDKKMVEGWKADADGIIIFTGLFSAAVASLISVSIQDIRPNPQDTSNFYLSNIYQTLADPNISSSLLTSPPPFSPPNYAVWVNALLFLSLVISITCALLATLLQQWARRYLKVTQPRYSLHKRARIRAFFFEGVDKFLLPWAVEALPTLLHVSLFLFFAGISVFLWNVNLTIFKLVLSWIGICTALYGCITFVPIFCHDSPYHTPLSLPARHVVTGISCFIFQALRWITLFDYFSLESYNRLKALEERYRKQFVQGMQRTAEETALNAPSEIDTRAFMWTFDSLDEDRELERFFSGLPGFRSSNVVDDPLPSLTSEQKWKLSWGLIGLLDVTFSSGLLPEAVKDRRAIICAKACDPAHIPMVPDVLARVLSRYQYSGPILAEIVRTSRGWGNDRDTDLVVQAAICGTVARAQQRDDSWFISASNELGVQESVLREYAAHGDSLSLAILIHVTRKQFSHLWKSSWPDDSFSSVLEAASEFNVEDTLPELQHEFCALWNQARSEGSRRMAQNLLRPIRNVYAALHQEAGPSLISGDLRFPSSYPVCNVSGHSTDSPSHTHNDPSSTTISQTDLRDKAALAPASLAGPDVPSSSMPAPLHIDDSLTDVPPLDNFHSVHQTIVESPRTPFTPSDIASSGTTMSHSTPETFTSAPPLSSTPLAVFALQHNQVLLAPSDEPNLPSSTASNLVLDNILPAESRRSIMVTAPSASSGPASVPDVGATTQGGTSQLGLRENKDALDPPSVNRAIHESTMPTLGLPSQAPSLPAVTDSNIDIAGPSLWEPNAEHIGDNFPHPSHGRHDIV